MGPLHGFLISYRGFLGVIIELETALCYKLLTTISITTLVFRSWIYYSSKNEASLEVCSKCFEIFGENQNFIQRNKVNKSFLDTSGNPARRCRLSLKIFECDKNLLNLLWRTYAVKLDYSYCKVLYYNYVVF